MSKFNVALYKLPVLYEILSEFKSELNFNLFNFNKNDEIFKNFIKNNPETLIISSELNKSFKNLIYYQKALKVKNLFQQINVYLSKSNYVAKANILIGKYKVDTNSRIISNEHAKLKLTEREIDLLVYLSNEDKEKTALDLQKNVWKHSKDLETHTVETHIYRLRKKIHDCFDDEKFIISNKNGYRILQ